MKKFWYGGQCSAAFGLMASGSGTYNAPERDVDKYAVVGRNGELTVDNGRFKNIPVTYPVYICQDFARNAEAARAWLLSGKGYRRLEDGYDPDHFRMAMFKGPINFDVQFLSCAGEAKLTFDCKPQRFLKMGEQPITLTGAGSVYGPTAFPALPLITVKGTGAGVLIVGSVTIKIHEIRGSILLDSELQDGYSIGDSGARLNRNADILAPVFPVLEPGENVVTWSGGITEIEIIPRWWTV